LESEVYARLHRECTLLQGWILWPFIPDPIGSGIARDWCGSSASPSGFSFS